MLLKDKVVYITGAGRGIGRGIAQAVAEEGAKVVVSDLQLEPIKETASLVERIGQPALPLVADVTSIGDVARSIERAVETFGRLDGMVNNAGVAKQVAALDTREQDYTSQFEVNVQGLFFCCQLAAKQMIAQGSGGRIVNIASNAGKVGFPGTSVYAASKAAVISFTRLLSAEWAKYDINVNAVCPGAVDTQMLMDVAESIAEEIGGDAVEIHNTLTPSQLGRHIQPIEVGRVVAFLLSDHALIIRGQSINVDAGETPY